MWLYGSVVCGSVALWICGSVAQWLYGSVALCLCGFAALWLCGSVLLGLCGFVALCSVALCHCVALWLCGSVALWLCGSVALWLCGSVALWLCGSVALFRTKERKLECFPKTFSAGANSDLSQHGLAWLSSPLWSQNQESVSPFAPPPMAQRHIIIIAILSDLPQTWIRVWKRVRLCFRAWLSLARES